ncbi:941_t:CDS:2 [Racocetra persica]|uniref:941_t:CDS:1 n=1 Tax=Racocetra persica TaxID=160502 RepID=A0ACA9KFJ0_9GLOM|nr:941_t:CDS:2 [Racocetra persica]
MKHYRDNTDSNSVFNPDTNHEDIDTISNKILSKDNSSVDLNSDINHFDTDSNSNYYNKKPSAKTKLRKNSS